MPVHDGVRVDLCPFRTRTDAFMAGLAASAGLVLNKREMEFSRVNSSSVSGTRGSRSLFKAVFEGLTLEGVIFIVNDLMSF